MGNNVVNLCNKSGRFLTCITFNSSDHVQLYYRDRVGIPVNGNPIKVDGIAGGGGVKVGVVYRREEGYLYYDLYWVAHGATLTINNWDEGSGVLPTKESPADGQKVFFMRTTSMRSGADHTAGVAFGLSTVTGVASVASQFTAVGNTVSNVILKAI